MTLEDYAREAAIDVLHGEAVMKEAAKRQCIYLFVEGKSEEIAFDILLSYLNIDFEEIGIMIANYGGINNLTNALGLLDKTLSNDRPVIVTYDNDAEGNQVIKNIKKKDYNIELITFFPIPDKPKVKYSKGHLGGSYEEMYDYEHFINCCFSEEIMTEELINKKKNFLAIFNKTKPWFAQIKKFCAKNEYYKFEDNKVVLAKTLAETCEEIPKTMILLSGVIKKVREEYPVKHPDDVELPLVLGLTC